MSFLKGFYRIIYEINKKIAIIPEGQKSFWFEGDPVGAVGDLVAYPLEQFVGARVAHLGVAVRFVAKAVHDLGEVGESEGGVAALAVLGQRLQQADAAVLGLQHHRGELLGAVLGAHKHTHRRVPLEHLLDHRTVVGRVQRPVGAHVLQVALVQRPQTHSIGYSKIIFLVNFILVKICGCYFVASDLFEG